MIDEANNLNMRTGNQMKKILWYPQKETDGFSASEAENGSNSNIITRLVDEEEEVSFVGYFCFSLSVFEAKLKIK